MRGAMRDRWCVAIRTEAPERAHALLRDLAADAGGGTAGMNLRAALPLFTVLALLSGCDDMTVQPKAGA